jgi:hypothetical protein
MKLILDGLNIWREERNNNNKDFIVSVEVGNLLEECKEYLDAENDYERIDALCDLCVFSINGLSYLKHLITNIDIFSNPCIYRIIGHVGRIGNRENKVEPLINILKHSKSMMIELGYDFEKCMIETIKEISSREQDPIQKEEWSKNGPSGKWQKNKQQNPDTLYKADYESCKLPNGVKMIEVKLSYNDHPESCQCEECQEWQQDYNKRNNTTY